MRHQSNYQLSRAQTFALREIALDGGSPKRPRPMTVAALEARGLVNGVGEATPLGAAAAHLHGWVPSAKQRELIVALANDKVLKIVTSAALYALRDRGVAMPVDGGNYWRATEIGRRVAAALRARLGRIA